MSTSLREGVSWAQEKNAGRVLIALADMPFVTPNHLGALIERCMARKENASFTKCGQRRSPPAAFGQDWFTPLRQLTGDAGARAILAELPANCGVEAAAGMLRDIDRPQDLPGAPSCA